MASRYQYAYTVLLIALTGCTANPTPTSGKYAGELVSLRMDLEDHIEKSRIIIGRHEDFLPLLNRVRANKQFQGYMDDIMDARIKLDDEHFTEYLKTQPNNVADEALFRLAITSEQNLLESVQMFSREEELERRRKDMFARMLGSMDASYSPTEAERQETYRLKYLWEEYKAHMDEWRDMLIARRAARGRVEDGAGRAEAQ